MVGAFYCSLIYLGRIAGFIGLSTEKEKPIAAGWFLVGGWIVSTIAIRISPILIGLLGLSIMGLIVLKVFFAFTTGACYFVIEQLKELLGVVEKCDKAIDTYIRDT